MYRCLTLVALLAAALWTSTPLAAQEVAPFATYAVSRQPTLEHSGGGGIFVSFDLERGFRLGAGVLQVRSQSERDGLACRLINPNPVDCRPERLEEQVIFRSFRLALLRGVYLTPTLRASPGVGIAVNTLNSQSSGESPDRTGNLYLPKTAHFGGFLRLDLSWWPVAQLPLGLTIAGNSHWVAFDGCIAGTLFYAPYCGARQLTELQAGISYRIPH